MIRALSSTQIRCGFAGDVGSRAFEPAMLALPGTLAL